MNLLYVDNYDSFAHLIAAHLELAGAKVTMVKSDSALDTILRLEKDLILLGPGPNGPNEAGNYLDLIAACQGVTPLFGICLGFQAMMQFYGGKVHPLAEVMHGKPSEVYHNGQGIFEGLGVPSLFGRYHSLGLLEDEIPNALQMTAKRNGDHNIVMGAKHHKFAVEGIQFHPESVLSPDGRKLFSNIVNSYLR